MENMENINDVEEEKELAYQKTIILMNSLECMPVSPSKAEMYQSTADKFSEMKDYKDSKEYIKQCKQLAKQTNADLLEKIYERAQDKKNKAKNADDYKLAAEEFRRAGGFKDAKDMALECDKLRSRFKKTGTKKLFLFAGGFIIAILAILFVIASPIAKYNVANVLYKVNSYTYALKFYNHSGNYKDSKKKVIVCQYKIGLDSEAKGNYIKAKEAFTAAGDYKDSDVRKVNALKQVLKNSKKGTIVKIGKYNWRVLESQDNQVLLIRRTAIAKRSYSNDANNATWENSAIRQYLNKDFLHAYFSKEERKNIIHTSVKNSSNATYGTDGGKDTLDYLFLLSTDEAATYKSIFKHYTVNTWLRSPGGNPNNAAFITDKGRIMDYGYIVTFDSFKAIPAMWFNTGDNK